MLSLDELRQLVASRRDRHRDPGPDRHAGPAAGQAAVRRVLPGRGRAARLRGLQLPARRRRRHEHGRRLRRSRPGSAATATSSCGRTSPRCAGSPGIRRTALVLADLDLARRHAGRRVAAADPAPPGRAGWPSAAWSRSPAPSSSSSSSATATSRRGAKNYRDLTPANDYNVDYSILGTSRIEPLLRRIRNGMAGAGMYVESAKGECNLGQHEIAFRYADARHDLRQPLDLQDRREGDRGPGRA